MYPFSFASHLRWSSDHSSPHPRFSCASVANDISHIDFGSALGEGDGENGENEERSAGSARAGDGACAEEDWQLVRDGAPALQREVSPVVVLQRSVYEERVQLLGGRFEALGTNADDDGDDENEDEIAADVDGSFELPLKPAEGQAGRAGGGCT